MRALLIALGIDNVGSGLFLPLTLVYATQVVGLPLAVAGVTVTAGTVVGLLVPPVADRFVDRVPQLSTGKINIALPGGGYR
jgi:hypothetical protein